MANNQIRVRFAPSPTGGLHLGGVRTALYNYLFARQHGGKFILRIEDTDQSRFVEGAEDYINNCLKWCGIEPDESPEKGGEYGPYRQSERKPLYAEFARKLVESGHAYYAFDTPKELEEMRNSLKSDANPSPQYDQQIRGKMKNSLTLPAEEVDRLLKDQTPHVIRILIPPNETIQFTDLIHGEVSFDSNIVDDKVLLKADGMPTYHLAVVIDDHLMQITHAFRGEEWLSSTPVHILLWKYLFGIENMPAWGHLPLILGPNGKLSKRDGAKYGFPVFAMNWADHVSGELTEGFKERGFLPAAFINMLAFLGWNAGTAQEIFSKEELVKLFSIERVHKAAAKFDFEKAKWFNQEWIKRSNAADLMEPVKKIFDLHHIPTFTDEYLETVISLTKERCTLLTDFVLQAGYFFQTPRAIDELSIKPKWSDEKSLFFTHFASALEGLPDNNHDTLEHLFKEMATQQGIKPGELQMIFRIMLVGEKMGPGVFTIASTLGNTETAKRIHYGIEIMNALRK